MTVNAVICRLIRIVVSLQELGCLVGDIVYRYGYRVICGNHLLRSTGNHIAVFYTDAFAFRDSSVDLCQVRKNLAPFFRCLVEVLCIIALPEDVSEKRVIKSILNETLFSEISLIISNLGFFSLLLQLLLLDSQFCNIILCRFVLRLNAVRTSSPVNSSGKTVKLASHVLNINVERGIQLV